MDAQKLIAQAVEQNIIDAAQANLLQSLAHETQGGEPEETEKFRFFKGFNDIFLSIGILLVGGAFSLLSNTTADSVIVWIAAILVLSVIGLVLKRHNSPSLPLITMSVLIFFFAMFSIGKVLPPDARLLTPLLLTVFVAGLFGLFRLPFMLALLASSAAFTVVAAVLQTLGRSAGGNILTQQSFAISASFLGCGLLTFAVAMWFDGKDPKRQTRNADYAFWLHICAAPMVIHPTFSKFLGNEAAWAILPPLLGFVVVALVALAIDRRAPIITSLAYVGIPIYHYVTSPGGDTQVPLAIVGLCLGVIVLLMGGLWHALRRLALSPFKTTKMMQYLPPI